MNKRLKPDEDALVRRLYQKNQKWREILYKNLLFLAPPQNPGEEENIEKAIEAFLVRKSRKLESLDNDSNLLFEFCQFLQHFKSPAA